MDDTCFMLIQLSWHMKSPFSFFLFFITRSINGILYHKDVASISAHHSIVYSIINFYWILNPFLALDDICRPADRDFSKICCAGCVGAILTL